MNTEQKPEAIRLADNITASGHTEREAFEAWWRENVSQGLAEIDHDYRYWALWQARAAFSVDHIADASKMAAPVVLPEPVAAQVRFKPENDTAWSSWKVCAVGDAREIEAYTLANGWGYEVRYLHTEQQVRELLATATQVPAQDITEKAAKYDHLLPYLCKTCGGYGLLDRRSNDDPLGSEPCPDCNAAPQPQAAKDTK